MLSAIFAVEDPTIGQPSWYELPSRLRVFDADTLTEFDIGEVYLPGRTRYMAVSPDKKYICFCLTYAPYYVVYHMGSFTPVDGVWPEIVGHTSGCAFSPDGQYLAVSGYGTLVIRLSDLSVTLYADTYAVGYTEVPSYNCACAFSPNNQYFAVATTNMGSLVYDTATWLPITPPAAIPGCYELWFSNDSSLIHTGSGCVVSVSSLEFTQIPFTNQYYGVKNALGNRFYFTSGYYPRYKSISASSMGFGSYPGFGVATTDTVTKTNQAFTAFAQTSRALGSCYMNCESYNIALTTNEEYVLLATGGGPSKNEGLLVYSADNLQAMPNAIPFPPACCVMCFDLPIFTVSGILRDSTCSPTARDVILVSRDTPRVVATTTSDPTTGEFELRTLYSGPATVVVQPTEYAGAHLQRVVVE
jgi:hypothetical protein